MRRHYRLCDGFVWRFPHRRAEEVARATTIGGQGGVLLCVEHYFLVLWPQMMRSHSRRGETGLALGNCVHTQRLMQKQNVAVQ